MLFVPTGKGFQYSFQKSLLKFSKISVKILSRQLLRKIEKKSSNFNFSGVGKSCLSLSIGDILQKVSLTCPLTAPKTLTATNCNLRRY